MTTHRSCCHAPPPNLTVLGLSPPAMIRAATETGYASVDLRQMRQPTDIL